MSDSAQIVPHRPLVKASSELSAFLGMEVTAMIDTIKAQCFKGKRPDEVTDAQLATYVSVANALKLNPLLPGMMYPYPDRNGSVTVMIGPDGVFTLLANNPDVVAGKDGGAAWWTEHGVDAGGKETCTAYINHRTKGLLKKTIWVDEWVVSSNPNWNTRRHHQSEIRALKQCARMVIHGLPFDSDELVMSEMQNVTPEPEVVQRKPAPERSKKGAAAVVENPTKTPDPKPATVEVEAKPVPTQQEQPAQATTQPPEGKVFTQSSPTVTKDAAVQHAADIPPPEKATPRAFLKDGEEIILSCTVAEVMPMMMKIGGETKPSVKVILKGGYNGEASHHGGGTGTPPEMGHLPIWEPGNTVKVKLVGKLQPMPEDPKKVTKYSGKVLARVMDVQQEGTAVAAVEVVE